MTHPILKFIRRLPIRFLRNEDGTATVLFLLFCLIFIVVGGMAIDFNKVVQERTQLQLATDSAAHAALYARQTMGADLARTKAMNTIDGMVPNSIYGAALTSGDIRFGDWDYDTNTFVEDESSRRAVRVFSQMTEGRGNASRNLLLSIIGYDTFNVRRSSVYTTYNPPCFNEGFVAQDVVDIQSNNAYFDGFCLHSNTYVSLNSNNFFEPGTVVSMPDLTLLDIPNSGFDTNIGLEAALRTGSYRLRLLKMLPDIIAGLKQGNTDVLSNLDSQFKPSGFVSGIPVPVVPIAGKINPASFNLGSRIYSLTCTGSGKVTMETGTYDGIIFVSNCEVIFQNDVILQDTIIATSNTNVKSLTSSHMQLGKDDNCAAGGGAMMLTLGGYFTASTLDAYGGQLLAHKDIVFAANADGIQGVNFQTYGQISGTSNMNMGFCDGEGTEDFLKAPYFRMVE